VNLLPIPMLDGATIFMLLLEMLARTIKQILRAKLRAEVRERKQLGDEPSKQVVVDELNLIFGDQPQSKTYWREVLTPLLARKFPGSLKALQKKPGVAFGTLPSKTSKEKKPPSKQRAAGNSGTLPDIPMAAPSPTLPFQPLQPNDQLARRRSRAAMSRDGSSKHEVDLRAQLVRDARANNFEKDGRAFLFSKV